MVNKKNEYIYILGLLQTRLVIQWNEVEKKKMENKFFQKINLLARCETLTGAHAGKALHILDVLECGLHLFLKKFVLLLLGEQVVCTITTHAGVHFVIGGWMDVCDWCGWIDVWENNKNVH